MSQELPAGSPRQAYTLHRAELTPDNSKPVAEFESLEYSSHVDSESYLAIHTIGQESSVTGHVANYHAMHVDATETIHEMHLALLYLLSNPDEFQRALATHPARGATTLAEWNAEHDNESMTEAESIMTSDQQGITNTPLPFVVFADDAEVVLPQAHTASQLFGVERLEGIELEAAAGIQAISQLFLRWLALMPSGDHLNIIDPPGLTVMKIAGGRYRVTAAHRVVWTWMNEFAPLTDDRQSPLEETVNRLQVGDLVSMTIVDVFETDNQGKLLSYCPTFDNRAIHKTHVTTETLRKSGNKLLAMLGRAQKSRLAIMISKQARTMATTILQKVEETVYNNTSPQRKNSFSREDEQMALEPIQSVDEESMNPAKHSTAGSANYLADDDTERHEV